ncbi:MAG: hypothetical protein ABR875_01165 [Minisyncoccia bacterium]|jgi:hypothetical protein
MLLEIGNITNYDRDIIPFTKNGIVIDTSIIKILIDGIIATRISKKNLNELPEYKNLLDFLALIKMNNKWEKLFVTPHILSEVCRHFRDDYSDYKNYRNIVGEVFPLLKIMEEHMVSKENIIGHIDYDNPVIEIGDISIFAVAQDFISEKKKTAILAKDKRINDKYKDDSYIMVMDYQAIMLSLL